MTVVSSNVFTCAWFVCFQQESPLGHPTPLPHGLRSRNLVGGTLWDLSLQLLSVAPQALALAGLLQAPQGWPTLRPLHTGTLCGGSWGSSSRCLSDGHQVRPPRRAPCGPGPGCGPCWRFRLLTLWWWCERVHRSGQLCLSEVPGPPALGSLPQHVPHQECDELTLGRAWVGAATVVQTV